MDDYNKGIKEGIKQALTDHIPNELKNLREENFQLKNKISELNDNISKYYKKGYELGKSQHVKNGIVMDDYNKGIKEGIKQALTDHIPNELKNLREENFQLKNKISELNDNISKYYKKGYELGKSQHVKNGIIMDEVVRNEHDFKREAKKEWERAWKEDRSQIKERLEMGGRRVPYALWKVVEKVHQLGFNKGLAVKIEYEENK